MKQLFNITLVFLALLLPATAAAHDIEVDGIYYNINGNQATVTFRGGTFTAYSDEYSGDVTIPGTVTYEGRTYTVSAIAQYAFRGCSGITSLTLGNAVASIGDLAFLNCTEMTSISVDSDNPYYDSRNNCNAIIETESNTLVLGCMNTVIPNSVATIGGYSFYGCIALTSVNLPNSVTSIGDHSFYRCTGITSFTIPNSVTAIGDWALSTCSSLTDINIPNSVTSIGIVVFQSCSGLTSVTIGNSVTSIGNSAFSYCPRLISVTSLATIPPSIQSSTFPSDVTNQATLYVPATSLTAYQNADYWRNFFSIQANASSEPGDVNGDGVLNVSDVTVLINFLMGYDSTLAGNEQFDVNGDGECNITDAIVLINMLINSI